MDSRSQVITSTPYDDVFRTLLNDCSRLIIPVINEVFHTSYTGKERIAFLPNEHFLNRQDGAETKRITDSCLMLGGDVRKQYHFECESTPDHTVIVRIFEYDSQIALDNSRFRDGKLVVTFPKSAVLFLRSRSGTPDEMITRVEFMNGASAEYAIPVIKVQKYSLDEIFEKRLLFLIPFYIFSHESRFAEYNRGEAAMRPILNEYRRIEKRLTTLRNEGVIDERIRHTIIDMSNKVLENIARQYDTVRKGVHGIMGGQVLEYETKTIYNAGQRRMAKSMVREMYKEGDSIERIARIAHEPVETIRQWIEEEFDATEDTELTRLLNNNRE